MTKYYPTFATLYYKDENIKINIPIKIKLLKFNDLICPKCRNKERRKSKRIECPFCDIPLVPYENKVYKLYAYEKNRMVNYTEILNHIFGRWYLDESKKPIRHIWKKLYACFIFDYSLKDMYDLIKRNKQKKDFYIIHKNIKLKLEQVTEEQLEEALELWKERKIEKQI